MQTKLSLALIGGGLLLALPAFPQQSVPNEVLVKFKAPTPDVLQQVDQDEDIAERKPVGGAGVLHLKSRSKDTYTLIRRLQARPDVEYAEPNYVLHAINTPNDSYMGLLWGMVNNGQTIGGQTGTPGADIDATKAWDITTGSTSNAVGVIDTGIDYTHPDLAPNVWSAPSSFTVAVGGRSITCAAGTHGFNAIANTCDPLDDNDHGTHVSGTIGAAGNNGMGVAGVNWTAAILAGKFLDKNGSGTTANALNAIEFMIQVKTQFPNVNVRVLSNSWGGGGFSQSLLDEINKAAQNGMLFVAAAGNSGTNNDLTPSYPASYAASNVVSVAATDNRDALASFSNYGATSVDLGAPGVYIASTVRNGGYAYMSGTSMATPHVSGAAALILSACPSLDTGALKNVILNSVDPVASLAGKTSTGGRLNVNTAIANCKGTTPPPAAPDFSLSADKTLTVTRGGSDKARITVTLISGTASPVALTASGLPKFTSAAFSPSSVTPTATSVLTVTANRKAAKGSYTIQVAGTSGSTTQTISVPLTIQ